eukprot:m51a1_g12839 hypothetical protein (555) ;mRNA; r:35-3158
METLAQLMEWTGESLVIDRCPLAISDAPRYRWRGLLLDVARHFLPIPDLEQAISSMAAAKLNVFHLHLTDGSSFPLKLDRHPELAEKGAYSPRAFYTTQQMRDLVAYAYARGVIVVPEIDTPGHVASWGKSHPEVVTDCWQAIRGVMHPENLVALDPSNPATWTLLSDVIDETSQLFKSPYFHIGADEVNRKCWEAAANADDIRAWMQKKQMPKSEDVEAEFVRQAQAALRKSGARPVAWEEAGRLSTLEKDCIVHAWQSFDALRRAVETNDAILSWGYYQDKHNPLCRQRVCPSSWTYMGTFRDMYWTDPAAQVPQNHRTMILNLALQRGLAVAERLWSVAELNSTQHFVLRSMRFRCYALRRGLFQTMGPLDTDFCDTRDYYERGAPQLHAPPGQQQVPGTVARNAASTYAGVGLVVLAIVFIGACICLTEKQNLWLIFSGPGPAMSSQEEFLSLQERFSVLIAQNKEDRTSIGSLKGQLEEANRQLAEAAAQRSELEERFRSVLEKVRQERVELTAKISQSQAELQRKTDEWSRKESELSERCALHKAARS